MNGTRTMTTRTVASLTLLILGLASMLTGFAATAGSASAAEGDGDYSRSPDSPTLVEAVPEGFTALGEPTSTTEDCVTTTEQVYSRFTPGTQEPSVTEYKYEREVPIYATEYHVAMFTQTKTRTYTPGTPAVMSDGLWLNFSPNKDQKTFEGPPSYPTDPRGTWQHQGQGKDIPPGHQGPDGVYQNGNGNSSWFYREAPKVITPAVPGSWGPWSPYGPWTKWSPESEASWQDSSAPLGTPQFHSEGEDGNTQWYRVWQAQHDGVTRQVQTGTSTETTDWLLEPPAEGKWTQIDERTTPGASTDPYTEYVYTSVTAPVADCPTVLPTEGTNPTDPTDDPTDPTDDPTDPTDDPTVLPTEGTNPTDPGGDNPGDPGGDGPGTGPGEGEVEEPQVLGVEAVAPAQAVPTAVDAGLSGSGETGSDGTPWLLAGGAFVLAGLVLGSSSVTTRGKRSL